MAEKVERIVDTTVARADNLKVQTADALEEAARKLREADVSFRGDEVKAIIGDIEARTKALGAEVGRRVEPMETFITDHPFTSVFIAVGLGFLIGSLASRVRD
jgi:ElaB/YqjD/DUF883 family membrane-anchored ribosome-binding protein